MICRVNIHLPKSARRRIRAYLRRVANPDRCPRCHSFDTWRWTKGNGPMGSVARYLGRQLLTCRSCANLFYVRADNKKPLLARVFESSGFAPLPIVRAWKTRSARQEPAAWLDRNGNDRPGTGRPAKDQSVDRNASNGTSDSFILDSSAADHAPSDSSGGEYSSVSFAPSQAQPGMPSDVANGTDPGRAFVAQSILAAPSAEIGVAPQLSTSYFQSLSQVEAKTSAAIMEPPAIAPEVSLSTSGSAVATANAAVDALFTKPTRQQPVNIRQWQDHSWEVCDWDGNVWKTTSAAASGGSAGVSASATVGDVRRVG